MKVLNIQIKESKQTDFKDIMTIHKRAFGYDEVADLTAALLEDETAEPIISLIAVYEGKTVGHILFTKAIIENSTKNTLIHILAPLAILPEYQKKGIGGLLIQKGLEILNEMGSKIVFVLGHIEYYPKYGFIPDAKSYGYPATFPIPEKFKNAWMLQPLTENFDFEKGRIICADKMNEPQHWRE